MINNKRQFTVVVDPGHGGTDPGASAYNAVEKQLTLTTALLVKEGLMDAGYCVVMTREGDENCALASRVRIANQLMQLAGPEKPILFLSIHYNANSSQDPCGIEVHIQQDAQPERLDASRKMAEAVLSKMIETTGLRNRGVKESNFQVIRETIMPAVLVECGFITNEQECALISQEAYQQKIASAIVQGIDEYFFS